MANYLSDEMIKKCTPMSSRKAKVYEMLLSIYKVATSDEFVEETFENPILRAICDDFARFSNGHWLMSTDLEGLLVLEHLERDKLYDLVINNFPHSNRKRALFTRLAAFAKIYLANTKAGLKRVLEDKESADEIKETIILGGFDLDDYPTDFAAVCSFFYVPNELRDEVYKESKQEDEKPEVEQKAESFDRDKVLAAIVRIISAVEVSDFITCDKVKNECGILLDELGLSL